MSSSEGAALEAVIEDDLDGARKRLSTFYPRELADLRDACRVLAALADEEIPFARKRFGSGAS